MKNYAENIKRIAREKPNKGGLDDELSRVSIAGNSTPMVNDGTETHDILGPLTLEVTLETQVEMEARPDQGWIYQDNDNTKPGVQVKRAKTAKIIDANNKEFDITEITYVEP